MHTCLPGKRRRRKKRNRGEEPAKRGPLGDFSLIFDRAPEADDRSEEGHWEGDLMMGSANRSAMVTLVDRKLRHPARFVAAGSHRGRDPGGGGVRHVRPA